MPRPFDPAKTAIFALLLFAVSTVGAETVRVAVAANFIEPAKAIGKLFRQKTGHGVVFSTGSTGQLYAQISQQAPFEVLLAGDQERPARAVSQGYALADSRFTYATGRLVLFSADPSLVRGDATLKEADFDRIAIANPTTAPYGAAAVAVMQALGVYDRLQPRIVRGNNVAQAYQFVDTGNAELGFVALSQLAGHDAGSRWLVPQTLHPPIAQDAVLLRQGADNQAAHGFLAFLKGPEADAVFQRFGYRRVD